MHLVNYNKRLFISRVLQTLHLRSDVDPSVVNGTYHIEPYGHKLIFGPYGSILVGFGPCVLHHFWVLRLGAYFWSYGLSIMILFLTVCNLWFGTWCLGKDNIFGLGYRTRLGF